MKVAFKIFKGSKAPNNRGSHIKKISPQYPSKNSFLRASVPQRPSFSWKTPSLPIRRHFSTGQNTVGKKVCIIGAGPSSFYALDALEKQSLKSGIRIEQIDMFERTPFPYGLVRYGVAADHPEVKAVSSKFENFFTNNRSDDHPIRKNFFGQVQIGKDIGIPELRKRYDVVVLGVGCEGERKLNIPGESEAKTVHSARDFVAFLNGHPDYSQMHFDLSHEDAAVVGNGNVALDVARILLKPLDELRKTDLTERALNTLKTRKIKRVHLIGRRGVVQASWTGKELREQFSIGGCYTYAFRDDIESLSEASQEELKKERSKKRMHELFATKATLVDRPSNLNEVLNDNPSPATWFHFLKSPKEIVLDAEQRATHLICEENRLEGAPQQQKAIPSGRVTSIPAGIIFRSVGYLPIPFADSEGIALSRSKNYFENDNGKIFSVLPQENLGSVYVTGWAKRGPSGIVGTNKYDSDIVIDSIFQEWSTLDSFSVSSPAGEIQDFLEKKNVSYTTWADWRRLDNLELEKGLSLGKPREKLDDWESIRVFLKSQ